MPIFTLDSFLLHAWLYFCKTLLGIKLWQMFAWKLYPLDLVENCFLMKTPETTYNCRTYNILLPFELSQYYIPKTSHCSNWRRKNPTLYKCCGCCLALIMSDNISIISNSNLLNFFSLFIAILYKNTFTSQYLDRINTNAKQ